MEGTIFINEAITKAINEYLNCKNDLNSKEYSSFLVVVIRALVFIYGELDIINPFRTNNEAGLGSFDANLKKYGLSSSIIASFKEQMQIFYKSDFNDVNSFKQIQKLLIEMFILKEKYVKTSPEEEQKFKNFLYFEKDTNQIKLDLYQKLTPNSSEILAYYNSKTYEQKHNYNFTEYKDIILSQEAYQIAGYNIVEVMKMPDKEIININNKVYHFFRIKDTDINKKKRLESAINYYKKYGAAITSGNGYVDLLLLMGVVSTFLMLAIVIAVHIGG
jgi:hypothetical protein